MASGSVSQTLGPDDVVNNLTSTATDKPLAAAQGKALSEAIAQSTATIKNKKLLLHKAPTTVSTTETTEQLADDMSKYTWLLFVLWNTNVYGIRIVVNTIILPVSFYAEYVNNTARTRYVTMDGQNRSGIDVLYKSNSSVIIQALNSYTADNYGIFIYGML